MRTKQAYIPARRVLVLIAIISTIVTPAISGPASPPSTGLLSPEDLTDMQLKRAITLTPRPFVLINQRELTTVRLAVAKDGWKKAAYLQPTQPGKDEYSGAGFLPVAKRWLKTDIRIPARGGHGHNFYCDCGTQLTLPPDMEPKAQYTCPACGRTFSGEKYDAAVRCFRHHELANVSLTLAIAYGIEQDKAYANKVAEILRKYARAYPEPHTNATTGGIIYQSLNEAMWVIPLAQAYDLIHDSGALSDDDKRLIEDQLFRPVAKGLIKCGAGGNWGSWHLGAVGVIGLAIRDVPMVRYAVTSMQAQLRTIPGDDGLWPESVHTYHFFALTAFVYFTEACQRAGIDLYNWEARPGRSLKTMFTAPLEYMYPSFQLPAINDGWYRSDLPLNLYEIARMRWDDPVFERVLSAGYDQAKARASKSDDLGYLAGASIYRFLFGHVQASPKPSTFDPKRSAFHSTNFPDFGLCTLRNGDDLMVTFHYGRFLGHGHLDKMSFTLFANGSLLIPDYGTPGYGSSILHWYQGTAGHNTVEVDGKYQARSKESNLTAFYSGSFARFAEAVATDVYPGVSHTRAILLLGNACIVSDTLRSDQEHDYDWLVRCKGTPDVIGDYPSTDFSAVYYPPAKFDRKQRITDAYSLTWKCDQTDLAFTIWPSPDGAAIGQGTCPAETDVKRASFLVCREHGREARFLSAFVPKKTGEEVKLRRNGGVVEIETNGGTDYVFVRGSGPADPNAGLQTDGEIAAVRTSNGEVTSFVLIRGTQITWRGKTLTKRPSPVECFEARWATE